MKRTDRIYQQYIAILREELVPAMGCTEPIAIALAAAKARALLDEIPDVVTVEVSGNIVKNVKSVIVPNTGGLRGIPAAAAAGIVAGNADKALEVLSEVTEDQIREIKKYLETANIKVAAVNSPYIFDIRIILTAGSDTATAHIVGTHTNVVLLQKNEVKLIDKMCDKNDPDPKEDRNCLTVENIVDFANSLDKKDVAEIFDPKSRVISTQNIRRQEPQVYPETAGHVM